MADDSGLYTGPRGLLKLKDDAVGILKFNRLTVGVMLIGLNIDCDNVAQKAHTLAS